MPGSPAPTLYLGEFGSIPSDEDTLHLKASLVAIEGEMVRYMHMFESGPLNSIRSRGIGVLTREAALEACAVGPTARASGMPEIDRRLRHPTYQKLGFTPVSGLKGIITRIMLRFQEVLESIAIIRRCLDLLVIRGGGIPGAGEIAYSGEAPRGELSYFIKTDAAGRVLDIAIQTPSIMNIEACCHYMLKGVPSLANLHRHL